MTIARLSNQQPAHTRYPDLPLINAMRRQAAIQQQRQHERAKGLRREN